ncbi:hypothetical protein KAH81_01300 [bacterium]|nr:hypothetical protein [bacterium]
MRKAIIVSLLLLLSLIAFASDTLPSLPKTNVDIPWAELRTLIEMSMITDTTVFTPPVDYIIPYAEYETIVQENALSGTVEISIVVLKKGYVEVQLFNQNLPLKRPSLDGKFAPLVPRYGKHTLIIKGPGKFSFSAGFIMEIAEHTTNFRLNLPQTSSTFFKLEVPGADWDVKFNPASSLTKKAYAGKTSVEAYIPTTDYLFCEWMKELPPEEVEDLEPIVYSELRLLYSVGEGMVKGNADLIYSIVQGKIDVVRFKVPNDVRVLDVRSSNLRDWKISEEGEESVINAYLKFPTGGTVAIGCDFERSMQGVSAIVALPVVTCVSVQREKGYIGVEATTNVEVSLEKEELEVASRIDRSEVPQALWSRANYPIILAFKYLETPYRIVLDIERHEDMPVKVATADNGAFVAILTTEGNYIVRGTYDIRNNLKQFLSMELPEDAELWSLFVSGNPAKPGKGDEGRILIPMKKSRGGADAASFPIEVVYFMKGKNLRAFGKRSILLPKIDVPVSTINLSLYLPYGYTYTGFGGNMEEGWMGGMSGHGIRATADEYMGAESNVSAPMAAKARSMDKMLESQVQYEEELKEVVQSYGATERGVLPVKIQIPEVGALHRFQKFIIPEDEKGPFPQVKVSFTKRGIKNVLTFLVVVLAVFAFLYFAKVVVRFFEKFSESARCFGKGLLKIIILGLIEILVLTWFTGVLAVSSSAISITWILGGVCLVMYIIIRFGVKKAIQKQKERKEAKKEAAVSE